MPRLIAQPTVVAAAGNKPKRIEEYAGHMNSGHSSVSVARMVSPGGWVEPGQRPEFEEITVVLRGRLRVEHAQGLMDVAAGQAIVTAPGEWVRYSTPDPEGAEYVAVCLPAFSPATVHRDPPRRKASAMERFIWPVVVAVLATTLYVAVRAKRDTLVDFEVYRTAATRAVEAAPLYRPEDGHYQFKYLPVFALIAAPLAWVPAAVATPAWFAISVVLLYVFIGQSARALPDRRRRLGVLVWIVVMCHGKFWVKELAFGQTNVLLGVLLLAALARAEQGRWWSAGALVGAATFVKPYAILFFPWLALVGGLIPAFAASAVLALGLLAPVLAYGWQGNLTLLAGWYHTVSSTTAPNLFDAENISFATMWAKWLGAGRVASMLALATSVAAIALVGAMLWKRSRVSRPGYLEFGALLMLVPLLSPQGWDYVLLIAAPAFFLLFDRWGDVSPAWRVVTAVAVALVSFTIFDLIGRFLYTHAMRLSVVTVGAMAIAMLLAHLRWKSLA